MSPLMPSRDDIRRLGAEEAEEVIQKMLKGLCAKHGISPANISRRPVRYWPDGGIELTIEFPKGHPFISFYGPRALIQVKSTKGKLSKSALKEELSKPEIKHFFREGGQFVLAYTNFIPQSGESSKLGSLHLKEVETSVVALKLKKHVQVEIWYPDTLETLIAQTPNAWSVFPFGATYLLGNSQTIEAIELRSRIFSKQGFDIPYVTGGIRESQLSDLMNSIASVDQPYIEIRGNMGVGKSRLAYEAAHRMKLDDVLLWHVDPGHFNSSELKTLLAANPNSKIWAVVDECSSENVAYLKSLADLYPSNLKIIAILPFRSDEAATHENKQTKVVRQMEDQELKQIVREFDLPDDLVESICKICKGYPKLARVLAQEVAYKKTDFSQFELARELISTQEFSDKHQRGWATLILNDDDREVMSALALFIEVGVYRNRKGELLTICDVLGIDVGKAEKVIHKNLQKGILSNKGDYVYVTPVVLANYLACDRFVILRHRLTPLIERIQSFNRTGRGRTSLLESLAERVRQAGADPRLAELEKEFLESARPFSKAVLSSKNESEILLAFAYSQPHYFLSTLSVEMRQISSEEIKSLKGGRRNLIWFLEKAAFYPELFFDSMHVLRLLALGENETWSNNATGIYTDFFSPILSGTVASLESKATLLLELLNSENPDEIPLAISALEHFLAFPTGRSTGHENRLNLSPIPIEPDRTINWKVYFSQISRVVDFIINKYPKGAPTNLAIALIGSLRFLVQIGFDLNTSPLIEYLKQNSNVTIEHEFLGSLVQILKWEKERISETTRNRLESLARELSESNFRTRLRRWTFETIADDYEIEDRHSPYKQLALEILLNPVLLKENEDILLSEAATRARFLLWEIGSSDKRRICWSIIETWRAERHQQYLSGSYLTGIASQNLSDTWVDQAIDRIEQERSWDPPVLFDVSKDIDTDASFDRILRILEKEDNSLVRLLIYGGRASRLSKDQLKRLIQTIAKKSDQKHAEALFEPIGQYLNEKKPIPTESLEYLLSLYLNPGSSGMQDHYRERFFKSYLASGPEKKQIERLIKLFLASLVKASDFNFAERLSKSLSILAERAHETLFKEVIMTLRNPERHSFLFLHMLSEWFIFRYEDALTLELQCASEEWAYELSKLLPEGNEVLNKATALIMRRFSSSRRFLGTIFGKLYSSRSVFSGPLSNHFVEKRNSLAKWAASNDLQNNEMYRGILESLESQIDREKKAEEEEDFLSSSDL